MDQSFDIFRVDQKGGVVWFAAANSLEEAKAIVEQLSKIERGIDFVILNPRNARTDNRQTCIAE